MSINKNNVYAVLLSLVGTCAYAEEASNKNADDKSLEEIHIWGLGQNSANANHTNPTSVLTQSDMKSINVATTEDLVKFEPSLVIRRRFIGDSNGTMGIRGSNMFQTSRSMVFADGVPLHYFLQSRWSGAPRWTMVSASEIAQVEVIYGPFSAEYSGNAMGGVVLIETAIPQEREFHVDGSFFSQQFEDYGADETVNGFKGFVSYGDKVGDLSYYLSYNHLENESQPQTFRDSGSTETDDASNVTGAIIGNNSRGSSRHWYGDTGVVDTTTDNLKLKVGYDFGKWSTLVNIAHEDRNSVTNSANSYVKDADGNTVWSGTVVQDGQAFGINSTRLNESELNRESLSVGLRVLGELSDNATLEANINKFDILKDENRSSARNPNDPAYTSEGQISDHDNSGWETAEVKLRMNNLGVDGLQLVSGIRTESYQLDLDVYNSDDYVAGEKSSYKSRFGGKTKVDAIFSQMNWEINKKWDLGLGLRYEEFESSDGYYSDDDDATDEFDLVSVPGVSAKKTSPKLSVGYHFSDDLFIRYSAAKAYRSPIAEELFSQYRAYNTVALANPELKPEDGTHHNVMLEKSIDGGYLRVNFFKENIVNAIESQTDTSTNVRSFVPIDEVETNGIEFIANQNGMFTPNLDVRFNLAYVESEIIDNSSAESASENSIEGNTYPRMPKWRGNILANYHITDDWDFSGNLQYASDSYGRIDNTDNEDGVYGGQDGYTRIGLKTTYDISEEFKVGFGIDNLTNEISYVAHPWPGRTFYLNFAYDM